jgi:PAS domain S-box-containing protein
VVFPTALAASTYRALFDTAPDAMVVCDAAGIIVAANPQAGRLFGRAEGALAGRPIEDLLPPGARARHEIHRARYVAQPQVRPMGSGQELTGQRADGTVFPVEIALSPIDTSDGRLFVASIRDISETQRARQALARARYDALLADIGRLLLQSGSQDAAFDDVPPMIARELGIACAAIVYVSAQTPSVRVRSASGMRVELQELLPELLGSEAQSADRGPDRSIVRWTGDVADGRTHASAALGAAGYGEFVAAYLYDRSRLLGALVAAAHERDRFDNDRIHVLRSVALLLAATAQRNRTEEQLAHAQRLEAIGQLTGGVAHDFNNLLTVISGNLQLLEIEGGVRTECAETLASAQRAVERGAGLTRKLLAFAGRQRLDPQAIDPRALLTEMHPILTRTLGQAISVDVECAGDLPNVFVDPGELDTAILNLALNARDAMPRGGSLLISARAEQVHAEGERSGDARPGSYVVIAVEDAGVGMTPEVLARAFEPFFTTKERGRGSGLGLSMVYGFVRQSGGFLKAESRLGYGTRIELALPAAHPAAESAPIAPAMNAPSGEGLVLVVEDEPDVRAIALSFLRSLGYSTLAAADAQSALELLRANPNVALLFSDVILGSGMTGHELARAAQRMRAGLPVLLTSGYDEPAGQEPGASRLPLLRKPYRREELGEAVRAAIVGVAT